MREEHHSGYTIKLNRIPVLRLMRLQQTWGHPTVSKRNNETVYGEGLKRENWTRYLLSGMKYNRIVIFKADL